VQEPEAGAAALHEFGAGGSTGPSSSSISSSAGSGSSSGSSGASSAGSGKVSSGGVRVGEEGRRRPEWYERVSREVKAAMSARA
jgi:hypothetical protein